MPETTQYERWPASYAQRTLYFDDAGKQDGQSHLTVPCVLVMRGTPDPNRLRLALRALVRLHPALRTALVRGGDDLLFQVVRPHLAPVAEPVELSGEGVAIRSYDVVRDMARAPIHVHAARPLWRARLVAVDDTHLLTIALHRSIADDWSATVIAQDLALLYCDPASSPRVGASYGRWAAVESGASSSTAHNYWTELLTGGDPPETDLPLPSGTPKPGPMATTATLLVPGFAPDTVATLSALATMCDARLEAVFAATLALALHRDTRRVVVGTTCHDRDPMYRRTVGPIADPVPLVVDLRGNPSGYDLMRRAGAALRDAHDRRLPLETLRPMLGHPDRDGPPFGLAVEIAPPSAATVTAPDGVEIAHTQTYSRPGDDIQHGWWSGSALLTCCLRRDPGGGMSVAMRYDAETVATDAVERLVIQWRRVLDGICSHPSMQSNTLARLGELSAYPRRGY